MAFFNLLTQQLGNFLNSQSTARKLMVFLIMGASMAALGFMFMHARNGSFKTLAKNLQPEDQFDVASRLRTMGIPIRFAQDGAVLQVPDSKWDQALMTLSQDGLPASGLSGYELLDKSSIGMSSEEQKIRYHRALEGELSRTIRSLKTIERAKVHLARPQPSLFLADQRPPTASVTLKTRGGVKLDQKVVEGLTHLVARAVEGLEPSAVSILNNKGEILSQPSNTPEAAAMNQLVSHKLEFENRMKERIERQIGKTVGADEVIASVNADFDFDRRTIEAKKDDSEAPAVSNDKLTSKGPDTVARGIMGEAGSDSNLPPGGATQSAGGAEAGTTSTIDRDKSYLISVTDTKTVELAPKLKRITVSVLVDGLYPDPNDGTDPVFVPRPPEEMAKYETAVRNIIGFSDERDGQEDVVAVQCVEFVKTDFGFDDETPAQTLLRPDLIREGIRWGIVGLISLILIFSVLRPAVKSVTVVPAPLGEIEGGGAGPEGLPRPEGARGLPESERNEISSEPREMVSIPGPGSEEIQVDIGQFEGTQEEKVEKAMAEYKIEKSGELEAEVIRTMEESPQKTAAAVRQWMEES